MFDTDFLSCLVMPEPPKPPKTPPQDYQRLYDERLAVQQIARSVSVSPLAISEISGAPSVNLSTS